MRIALQVALLSVVFSTAILGTAIAKEGDADATGKITSVDNRVFQIRVKGYTHNGPLWLGCTFFPGTDNERDLKAEQKNVRGKDCLFLCSGSFDQKFIVPQSIEEWAMSLAGVGGEAPYAVALWRYYVPRDECHAGPDGGACEYCLKNGYHLEDCVHRGRGTWSLEKKTTNQSELERAQREAAEQEEEAARRAQIEEQQRHEREEAERRARIEEQQRREREEAERRARIEEQQQRERENAEQRARAEEQRRKEQKEAEQRAKIEKERRRAEAAAETRRNQRVMLGATLKDYRGRGFRAAQIVRVDPGSPAARAGLKPGMVVTHVRDGGANVVVSCAADFPTSGKRGDSFNITVVGETQKFIQIMDRDF